MLVLVTLALVLAGLMTVVGASRLAARLVKAAGLLILLMAILPCLPAVLRRATTDWTPDPAFWVGLVAVIGMLVLTGYLSARWKERAGRGPVERPRPRERLVGTDSNNEETS